MRVSELVWKSEQREKGEDVTRTTSAGKSVRAVCRIV